MLAMLAEWAVGREWAVAAFGLMAACAVLIGLARGATDDAAKTVATPAQHASYRELRRSYLAVYAVVMLADWLQGTHMYTLYTGYAATNPAVSAGTLFFTGFLSAGVLGTFVGPLVDRHGRKKACLVYVVLEVAINLLETVNRMDLLMLGRVIGGVSTSLLFTAFEAWMVSEHRRRGLPKEWLGKTFGACAVWNGATAIAAGFIAQLAADRFGDIGPFQLAIALTVLAGALILPWRENYGEGGGDAKKATEAAASTGLLATWREVRGQPSLLLCGATYALFEGGMYCFVFNWVPSLASALGGFGAFAPVQGLLFSCLMAAISIGGEVYNLASRLARVEVVGVGVFAAAAACMAAPVWCDAVGCGERAFAVQFGAFLLFEVCVGAFQPCMAVVRSKYIPDASQARVNGFFRLPLNAIVAGGTLLSDAYPPAVIFALCTGAHLLAMGCQLSLVSITGAAAASKKGK